MVEEPFVMRVGETVDAALERILAGILGLSQVLARSALRLWCLCIEPHEHQSAANSDDSVDDDDDPVHEIPLGPCLILKLSQPLGDDSVLCEEVRTWQSMYPDLECRLSVRKIDTGSCVGRALVQFLEINPMALADDGLVFAITSYLTSIADRAKSPEPREGTISSAEMTGDASINAMVLEVVSPPPRPRYLSCPAGPKQLTLASSSSASTSVTSASGVRTGPGHHEGKIIEVRRLAVPMSSIQLALLADQVVEHLLREESVRVSVAKGLEDNTIDPIEGELHFTQMLDECQNGLVAVDASSGTKRAMLVDLLLALGRGNAGTLRGLLSGEFDLLEEMLPRCVDPEGIAKAGIREEADGRSEELLDRGASTEQRALVHRSVVQQLQANPCAGSIALPVVLSIDRIWSEPTRGSTALSEEGKSADLPPGLAYLVEVPDDDGKHAVALVAGAAGVLVLRPGGSDSDP